MSECLRMSVTRKGDVTILKLSGKITISPHRDRKGNDVIFREKVVELLEAGQGKILLNLERLTYMDSAGLGEFVACYKRVKENGGALKILKPRGKVEALLALTKLIEVFSVFEHKEEALRSFE